MQLQKGLVSVIVPTYNVRDYIDQCLSCLVQQTYQKIEVIVIDDNSNDGTRSRLLVWESDQKIKVIYNNDQSGPSKARNCGLDIACGEYIVFCDADDWMEKDAIQNLIDPMMKSSKIDIVFSNHNFVYNDNRIVKKDPLAIESELSKGEIVDCALKYLDCPTKFLLFSHSWSTMFKSEKIGTLRFNENLFSFEDMDFNFKYLRGIDRSYYTTKITYNHRVRGENYASTAFSISTTNPNKLFGYLIALQTLNSFVWDRINYHADNNLFFLAEKYGNALIRLTIVQLIRVCGQLNESSWEIYKQYIDQLINRKDIQRGILWYKRKPGDSRIIPWLINLRWTYLLMIFCQKKAKKRYG